MRLLAIESSSGDVAVALADETGPLASMTVRSGRRHVELLHPLVGQVCEVAGVALAELDAIAVDVGPGLFTGIRVGVAAAKGFAMALGIPVVPLTSLEILRAACQDMTFGAVVPVVDLRRGEVAWCLPGGSIAYGSPDELARLLDSIEPPVLLAGGGALRYEAVLAAGERAEPAGGPPPPQSTAVAGGRPVGAADRTSSSGPNRPVRAVAGAGLAAPPVASLAVRAVVELESGRVIDPPAVLPIYLRDADARINWTTRHDAPALDGVEAGTD